MDELARSVCPHVCRLKASDYLSYPVARGRRRRRCSALALPAWTTWQAAPATRPNLRRYAGIPGKTVQSGLRMCHR
jgi:hypothetical protein